jgi:hypothetical protein
MNGSAWCGCDGRALPDTPDLLTMSRSPGFVPTAWPSRRSPTDGIVLSTFRCALRCPPTASWDGAQVIRPLDRKAGQPATGDAMEQSDQSYAEGDYAAPAFMVSCFSGPAFIIDQSSPHAGPEPTPPRRANSSPCTRCSASQPRAERLAGPGTAFALNSIRGMTMAFRRVAYRLPFGWNQARAADENLL